MTTPVWRKSSRSSQGTSGQCVELAEIAEMVAFRDSKNPDGPKLLLSRAAFREFTAALKR